RTVSWQPTDMHFPSSDILRLVTARDGTLWIGAAKGLASLKDGKLIEYPEFAGQRISRILEDHEGSVWIGGFGLRKLCNIHNGSVRCSREDATLVDVGASFYEDRKGNLWVGVSSGVWKWKPEPQQFYPVPGQVGIPGLA